MEIKFSDLIGRYVIKAEAEKVRKNTANDFGLEDGFLYMGGRYDEANRWTLLYGWLAPGTGLEHRYHNLRLLRVGDKVVARGSNNDYPGSVLVAESVTDIPADVLPYVRH